MRKDIYSSRACIICNTQSLDDVRVRADFGDGKGSVFVSMCKTHYIDMRSCLPATAVVDMMEPNEWERLRVISEVLDS